MKKCVNLTKLLEPIKTDIIKQENSKNIFNKKSRNKTNGQCCRCCIHFCYNYSCHFIKIKYKYQYKFTCFFSKQLFWCSSRSSSIPQIIYHQCIIATLTIIIIVKIHQVLFLLLVQIILQVVFIQ